MMHRCVMYCGLLSKRCATSLLPASPNRWETAFALVTAACVVAWCLCLTKAQQVDLHHAAMYSRAAFAHVLCASVLPQVIMHDIYAAASSSAKEFGVTLAEGANIAGFEKVAKAMLAQGAV